MQEKFYVTIISIREFQQGFTQDLPKIYRRFTQNKAIFDTITTRNLPKFYWGFTLNLPKIYSAYQTLTQSLPKIYPKFGVYLLKFTQDLP